MISHPHQQLHLHPMLMFPSLIMIPFAIPIALHCIAAQFVRQVQVRSSSWARLRPC
jgi:hypothetical protein